MSIPLPVIYMDPGAFNHNHPNPPQYPAFTPPNHVLNPGPPPPVPYHDKERVRVYVTADTWVVGMIVGIVHLASMITGRRYKYNVQFESIDGSRRVETRQFFHEDLRPYQSTG